MRLYETVVLMDRLDGMKPTAMDAWFVRNEER